jgi:hypothetical protein
MATLHKGDNDVIIIIIMVKYTKWLEVHSFGLISDHSQEFSSNALCSKVPEFRSVPRELLS